MMKSFALIGALAALCSVIFGAFGAHALKSVLSASQLTAYHTAVDYQFYHALALLGLVAFRKIISERLLLLCGVFFIVGIVFFSGSIYMLTLLEWRFVGPVTPLGGLCFIIGWGCFVAGIAKAQWHE